MKNKAIIALLSILVIVFAFLGYLLSTQMLTKSTDQEAEREFQRIEQLSESDDKQSIEEDLEMTELESLDSELLMIEAELNATD